MTTYPEHDGLREVKRETQAIVEFMGWLERCKAITMRQLYTDYPVMDKVQDLVAEFYDIDLEELAREKDRMVEDMRRVNEPNLDPKA